MEHYQAHVRCGYNVYRDGSAYDVGVVGCWAMTKLCGDLTTGIHLSLEVDKVGGGQLSSHRQN
ncbi:hypothetical protein PspLS_06149 [Pyricularia sp. CBS 133598]|nr:hypothetical protein PspLS_06149 [Pyricularia sp. CBS 133598]